MAVNFFSRVVRWFGLGALTDHAGQQLSIPNRINGRKISVDEALQISAVYACCNILSSTIASMPLFVYENKGGGKRDLARTSQLWPLLHSVPNKAMTCFEFWQAMGLMLHLRGNAYAQIIRDDNGSAIELWPLNTDQMEIAVLDDGTPVYKYYKDGNLTVMAQQSILHLKGLGNGRVGLSKLEFMSNSADEAANAQKFSNELARNGGKPSGVLTIDHILKEDQRKSIVERFAGFRDDNKTRIAILEAGMKFEAMTLSPQETQLLQTRHFGIEEICRWFGVPSVLIGSNGATTWGSGIEQIIDGFSKFTLRPTVTSIEQAIAARVLTAEERSMYTVEFSFDALLRASIKERFEVYSKAVQNGLKTRNECRQLENDPPIDGGDELTAQTNLVPLNMLGKTVETKQTPVGEIKQ